MRPPPRAERVDNNRHLPATKMEPLCEHLNMVIAALQSMAASLSLTCEEQEDSGDETAGTSRRRFYLPGPPPPSATSSTSDAPPPSRPKSEMSAGPAKHDCSGVVRVVEGLAGGEGAGGEASVSADHQRVDQHGQEKGYWVRSDELRSAQGLESLFALATHASQGPTEDDGEDTPSEPTSRPSRNSLLQILAFLGWQGARAEAMGLYYTGASVSFVDAGFVKHHAIPVPT